MAAFQKKLIPVDDHVGIAIAGLTSDARVLRYINLLKIEIPENCIFNSTFMRTESTQEKMTFDRPISIQKLATAVANSIQPASFLIFTFDRSAI